MTITTTDWIVWGQCQDDDDHEEFRQSNAHQCRFCRILQMTHLASWHLEYCPQPADAVGRGYWRAGYESGRLGLLPLWMEPPVDEYLLGLFLGTLDRTLHDTVEISI